MQPEVLTITERESAKLAEVVALKDAEARGRELLALAAEQRQKDQKRARFFARVTAMLI